MADLLWSVPRAGRPNARPAGGVRGAVARTVSFYQRSVTRTGFPSSKARRSPAVAHPLADRVDLVATERLVGPAADLLVEEPGLRTPRPGRRHHGQDPRLQGRRRGLGRESLAHDRGPLGRQLR